MSETTTYNRTDPFPIDWNEWRTQWDAWRETHRDEMTSTSWNFGPKNFLADEIIGKWTINNRPVELSEVTMPDFSKGYGADRVRYIGITFGQGSGNETAIVATFAELETALGIR